MPVVIIENETDFETIIIRKNEYCILINNKVVMKAFEEDEWLSDETLTPQEWDTLNDYLQSP